MASPFPGMDPYLEGYLWPDVHHALASEIRRQLVPHLGARYVARIEVRMVRDASPEAEIGIMYPDVEIMRPQRPPSGAAALSPLSNTEGTANTLTPALLELPLFQPEVRLRSVEVRDAAQNQLVTSIELLSPVNKREPGLTQYREKWQQLHEAGVHLLEVDLLRRGSRSFSHPRLPHSAYLIALTRARADVASLWPLALPDPLPVVPVPLRAPDADVPLDLGLVLRAIYEEANYGLSIRYNEPPPPPSLSDEEEAWLANRISLQGE